MNEERGHSPSWFRPLSRKDGVLLKTAALLLVLAWIAAAFGNEVGFILGGALCLAGLFTFTYTLCSRNWRHRNRV